MGLKMSKQTRTILKTVAPKWVNRLIKANWMSKNLGTKARQTLDSDPDRCFIGEIYCNTSIYSKRGHDRCEECLHFCKVIPLRMSRDNIQGKKDVMLQLADHMKIAHPDIIVKKLIGND